jgi:predicted CXXCH cytochrome family protein
VNTTQVPQQEVCFTCHRDIRALVMRPSHHPIPEGKVKCTSCHNPHGSRSVKLLKEKVPNLCQDCHDASQHPGNVRDARAGFTGSAPDVRFYARSCLNCHSEIHGSNGPAGRGRRFAR